MNLASKIKILLVTALGLLFFSAMGVQTASADPCFVTTGAAGGYTDANCPPDLNVEPDTCYSAPSSSQGVGEFSEIDCDTARNNGAGGSTPEAVKSDCEGDNIKAGAADGSNQHCGILDYLVLFINVLSGLVGVVVVGSIIYAGIQYSTAGSDPQKVSAAKDRIRNALIALAFFIFMYSFLNYLVPGGVL
ncbi:MAG: hypothetical protein WAQ57_01710 [Candidatus Saccharimonadales bacterium]